jgi:hypothetical protein
VEELLELTDADIAVIEERLEVELTRRIMGDLLKSTRGWRLTLAGVAKMINSSQSRIAKAEEAD